MIPLHHLAPGVEPTGDFLVYLVRSSSRQGMQHRVDLSAWSGFGECGCESFQMRKSQELEEGARPKESLECPHIRAARRYFAIEIAQAAITRRANEANRTKPKTAPPFKYSHGERAI